MGNGLTVQGKCLQGRGLSLQSLDVIADFLPLELGGSDVVLSMQWLETLGTMQVNWQLLHMKFNVGGVAVTLQGDPSLSKTRVSLKAMCRTMQQEGDVILLEFCNTTVVPLIEQQPVPASISDVTQQFQDLFEPPQGLPPACLRDHAITLRE
ncbi:hypothetical protein TorRG33x02_100290, partial [Trema orientale]